ncbi:MAG: trypsin-like peptidase domain-containing protein [Candidatus Rokubacteria bacterium]|nr:trypsin-like peptidase domain-containing protein [Candidatus Rokubacteria bacterium]
MSRAVLCLALGLLISGCASAPSDGERGEIIRRILPSTVQLRAERQGGARRAASGVVLASDPASGRSWIITTRHFLDPPGAQEVYVSSPGRKGRTKAVVAAVSPDLDLAVIEVDGLSLPPVRFKEVARLGDEVWVVAFPWGRRLTVVSGVVSQLVSREDEVPVEGTVRMVDASVSYGASGGGVFDAESGALIGIVEGYRTANVSLPEAPSRVVPVPVPGETTVIAARTILRFLTASGLEAIVPR